MPLRLLLFMLCLSTSTLAFGQVSVESFFGKWQTRQVVSADGDSSYNYYKRDSLRMLLIEEELQSARNENIPYGQEDSIRLTQQIEDMLTVMFETTYHFKENNLLTLNTYSFQGGKKAVVVDGSYTYNAAEKSLLLTVNNSPLPLFILEMNGNSMVVNDDKGNKIYFAKVE
jgi:hypothetical protein